MPYTEGGRMLTGGLSVETQMWDKGWARRVERMERGRPGGSAKRAA